MKKTTLLIPAMAALSWGALSAQPVILDSGEADVGIAFEAGEWDLHVHLEESGMEFEPDEVIFRAGTAARTQVPGNPSFSFLGAAGANVWILPQVENPEVVYVGIGSEEISDGTFVGDEYELRLVGVSGPGNFVLYSVDGFGTPNVIFDSGDGIGPTDVATLPTGGHEHFNWAFTVPGTYELTFQAAAELPGPVATESAPTVYTFQILPPEQPVVTIDGRKRVVTKRKRHVVRGEVAAELGVQRVMVKVGRERFKAARVNGEGFRFVAKLDRKRTRVIVQATDVEGAKSLRSRIIVVRR